MPLVLTPPASPSCIRSSIPWQPRPAGSSDLVWRDQANPLFPRNPLPGAARLYNSAVVPFQNGFAGVFRADHKTGFPSLHVGQSADGLRWNIDPKPLPFASIPNELPFEYGYDPRVTLIDDRYYITWCNGCQGPTIGLAVTKDFQNFEQLENAFLPYNRNGVLFPRKINGKYLMLSRPSDRAHTPFGDIYCSASPDLEHWGHHRLVMTSGPEWWQATKIGAGPVPIETPEGWLVLYHGVSGTCSGMVYSMGVALLDLDQPWKVLARSKEYIATPEAPYETTGFVPNVFFPCAALHDQPTGQLAIYYGAADTYCALAYSRMDYLLEFLAGCRTNHKSNTAPCTCPKS